MAIKVFVSHSAKTAADRQVLDRLAAKLKADKKFDPWVDRERLKVGDNWNQDITNALRACHAAIVLFSKAALKSHFVKYEVSNLVHRKRSQTSFGLFPVIIDATDIAKLQKDFYGAIQFDDFQVGTLAAKEDEVFTRLAALDPKLSEPTNAIEGMLMQIFRKVAAEALREAAAELGWETWQDAAVADAEALSFLRQLLAAPLQTQILALNKVRRALPESPGFSGIFNLIAPWWVDDQAALCLGIVQRAPRGQRSALLNGTLGEWTCRMFMQRARPREEVTVLEPTGAAAAPTPAARAAGAAPPPATASPLIGSAVPAGRRPGHDLVVQVRRNLCARYSLPHTEDPKVIDPQIDAKIEEDEAVGNYPVQIVHLGEHGLSALGDLLDAFGRLTFVAMTGATMPQVPARLQGRVTIVAPPLLHDEAVPRHSEAYAIKWYNVMQRQSPGRPTG